VCKITSLYIFSKIIKHFIELKLQILLKVFGGDIISTSENAIVSYAIVKLLCTPSTLASSQHDESGTGFKLCLCCIIDRLFWWEMTYCIGHGSADAWDYVRLCVLLE
jgi:hypothetical protein